LQAIDALASFMGKSVFKQCLEDDQALISRVSFSATSRVFATNMNEDRRYQAKSDLWILEDYDVE
jgi:hypothetical protein